MSLATWSVRNPIPTTLLSDNFDPTPQPVWSHELVNPGLFGCSVQYKDEWKVASRDATQRSVVAPPGLTLFPDYKSGLGGEQTPW